MLQRVTWDCPTAAQGWLWSRAWGSGPSGFSKSFLKDLRRRHKGLCHFKQFCSQWQQWNRDFAEFQKKVEDANRQLAAIFCQGFDDCNCLPAAVKVPVPQLSSLARSSHRTWGSRPSWDCSRV